MFCIVIVFSCQNKDTLHHNFSSVTIEDLINDSISVRAITIINDSLIGFGYQEGYGFINISTGQYNLKAFKKSDTVLHKNWITEQRAVAHATTSFFSLGIGSPARLRKVNLHKNTEKVVYIEEHPTVFYDAMTFWDHKEGIAMGDPTDNCLSIIITRGGGEHWDKVSCDDLPKVEKGEAAFAASNGNIAVIGDHTWIVSGGIKSRVFYSPDRGRNWDVYDTPIVQGTETSGAYSIHFYDQNNGFIYGGDYTDPENNNANKAITDDGGKTWELIADGKGPGYRSCIRFIPNSGGKEMIAVGFTGISISNDKGKHWKELSKASFYTIRFINDSTAIAAGKYRIAKLSFR